MPQQHHRLTAASAVEIYLQVIAKVLYPVKFRMSAEPLKSPGKQRPQPVDRLLVVAGRLGLYQLANRPNNLVVTLPEITQGLKDFALGNGFAWLCFQSFLRHAILFW